MPSPVRRLRVLVLGGTGCVGAALVRQLAGRGHDVAVFHRGAGGCSANGALHLHGNRLELESHTAEFSRFAPDVVVDLIAGSAAAARRTLRAFAVPGRRLVFASSQEVYRAWSVFDGSDRGALAAAPLTEDSPLRCAPPPPRAGAVSGARSWMEAGDDKVGMERALRAWPGASPTIVRLAPVYGPGDRQHRLYPLFRRMRDGRSVILLPRDWAEWRSARGYVENMAAGLVLAVEQPRAAGRVYNLADSALSGLEWVQAAARAFGWRGRVLLAAPRQYAATWSPPEPHRVLVAGDRSAATAQPAEGRRRQEAAEPLPPHLLVRANTAQHCHADSRRIRVELGYREPVGLVEALSAALAWESRRESDDRAERERIARDYASEDAVLLSLGVGAGAVAATGGTRSVNATKSSATTTNTQTLPSGPTLPPVIQREP